MQGIKLVFYSDNVNPYDTSTTAIHISTASVGPTLNYYRYLHRCISNPAAADAGRQYFAWREGGPFTRRQTRQATRGGP